MASRIVIPSYHNGFYSPRRGGVARHPWAWRGCVGAWCPSLGATGGRLFDQSVYSNHGTLTNMDAATDWVISGDGRALDFDGSNDYIALPSRVTPLGAKSFTGWFRTETGIPSQAGILGHIDNTLMYGWRVSLSSGKVFAAFSTNTAGWQAQITGTTTVTDQKWHMFALTWDGTTAANGFVLYVDNILQGTTASTEQETTTPDYNLTIGTLGSNPTYLEYVWKGNIDDVRIYKRALPAADVRQLYSLGRGGAYALEHDDYKAGAAAAFKAAWLAGSRQTKIIGGGLR